ncbi:MAG: glutathione peroxidase [Solobacterium sp.]|nr:glutathione peroxidase [Solobacterium sp.]
MTFYDYSVLNRKGEEVSMKKFEGKVVLVVNTATGCGFTPHYEPIEKMYEELHEQGFEVLDIPCNQFGSQTPGTDEEVHEFCTLHYKTQFDQMKKSDVNGENQLPLYGWLKEQKGFAGFGEGKTAEFMNMHLAKIDPDFKNNPNIKWNFTKFVIDRAGNVVARFEPTADMADVEACVKSLL